MCLFGYYLYDECRHKGIELVSHCVERLWKAGMEGQLWACPEIRYIRLLTGLSPLTWEGKYGYCKFCQRTYAMPETVSPCSFNDLNVSTERSQPIPPSEDPYIYTPFVYKNVSELLRIFNEIPPEEMCDGFKITFPSNLETYDRTEAGGGFQWLSQGWYTGSRVGPVVSRFSFRNGMTFNDQRLVAEAIVKEKLLGLWRQEFKRRGMPWARYLAQARIVGASIGVHHLERIYWEEVGRSCSAEMEDFSENMRKE